MKRLTLILSMMIALVGLNANAAMYIVGNNPFGNWHTYTGAEMTDNGNGIYTYVTDQINGTVWFVFADNLTTGDSDDWNTFNGNYRYGPLTSGQAITAGIEYTTQKSTNGNVSYSFAGTLGESYQFTFDTNTMKFKVEGYVAPVIINTYSVAGEPAEVFGNPTWNEKATETEMTLVDGLYTWTKNGVELTSGTKVAFKIVGNHDWGYAWPADNYVDTISETGTYNLTFTFNADNEEVNLVAEKVGEGPVIDPFTGSLYITGQVNGNGWNPSTAIEMTNAGDDDTFTLANAQITDSGDGFGYFSFMSMLGTDANTWPANEYRLGAAADGTPAVLDEFVDMGGFNTTGAFKIEPGYYNITVVLSGGEHGLLKLTAGEAPEPVVDDVYILGDVNNIGWNATDGVKMTFNEGIYTANITTQNQGDLGIAYFGFTKKLAETNDSIGWASIAPYRFGPVSEGAFVMTKELLGNECSLATDGSFESIAIPEGTWTVTVDLVNNKFTINGEWPVEPLRGDVNSDGNVTIADVSAIIDYLLTNNADAINVENADCNLSNDVTIADVSALIDYLLSNAWPVVEHVYTVAGTPSSLFGSEWDPENEGNNMVKGADGKYTWKYEGYVASGAVEVEFKVVQDHNWDYAWPASNYTTLIGSEGYPMTVYNVTITFDPETKEIGFSATVPDLPNE